MSIRGFLRSILTPGRLAATLLLLVVTVSLPPCAAFAADDWDITGGHFFTQSGGGGGKGYVVSDDGGIRFWSEFNRLGGTQAVGYPVSHRFSWDGYTVQAFQRMIFQWRPESQSVAFVNVFDRLSQLGKDEWLLRARQTPAPIKLDEQGKNWDEVVKGRLGLMAEWPAIKAKYYDVVGDPVQANGLPTSAVIDMGNHYALRCQRVVFQHWKEDVPWAQKGMVTVALGGDIAKETGVLPDQAALRPSLAPAATPGQGSVVGWVWHTDAEKTFKYPAGWQPYTRSSGGLMHNYYQSPDLKADIYYLAPWKMGAMYKLDDFVTMVLQAWAGQGSFVFTGREAATINGMPAIIVRYDVTGDRPSRGVAVTIQRGEYVYFIAGHAVASAWPTYEPSLMESLRSYTVR